MENVWKTGIQKNVGKRNEKKIAGGVHTCTYSTIRVGDFRDKHVLDKNTVYGSGLTVWEHKCLECGTTLFSVSQWQYPPEAGGVREERMSGLKVRTPMPVIDSPKPNRPKRRHGSSNRGKGYEA